MQTAIHYILLGTRYAALVWLFIGAFVAVSLAALTGPTLRQRRADSRRLAERARQCREQLIDQSADLERYASELAVAAERATRTASLRKAEWTSASRTAEAVWAAFERADEDARRALAAAPYQSSNSSSTPDDIAYKRRRLHGCAAAAHRRGELSAEQYADVLLGRHGWDPERHPADLETMLCRTTSEQLLSAYRTAAAVERTARHDADFAEAASVSLNEEARIAALRAAEVRDQIAMWTPGNARVRASGLQPSPALS